MSEANVKDSSESGNETLDDNANYIGPAKVVDVDFSVPQESDPQRINTPGGIYLDREERKRAEVYRAQLEDRAPDLDNPPPIAGTPLVQTAVLKGQYPGDWEVPVETTLEQVIGTDDPASLRPEDKDAWVKSKDGGSSEEKGNTVEATKDADVANAQQLTGAPVVEGPTFHTGSKP